MAEEHNTALLGAEAEGTYAPAAGASAPPMYASDQPQQQQQDYAKNPNAPAYGAPPEGGTHAAPPAGYGAPAPAYGAPAGGGYQQGMQGQGQPPQPYPAGNSQVAQGPNGQVLVAQMYPPVPIVATCPFCSFQGGTVVTKQEGSGHSTCCCLSCLGGGLIGVCIFYLACAEDYKDSVHRCQRCGAVLGVHEKKAC